MLNYFHYNSLIKSHIHLPSKWYIIQQKLFSQIVLVKVCKITPDTSLVEKLKLTLVPRSVNLVVNELTAYNTTQLA